MEPSGIWYCSPLLVRRLLVRPASSNIALLVEQGRRIDGERDADLALVQLVDIDDVGREAGQVVVGLGDQRREVEPLAVERVRPTDADRPDDIRAVAGL